MTRVLASFFVLALVGCSSQSEVALEQLQDIAADIKKAGEDAAAPDDVAITVSYDARQTDSIAFPFDGTITTVSGRGTTFVSHYSYGDDGWVWRYSANVFGGEEIKRDVEGAKKFAAAELANSATENPRIKAQIKFWDVVMLKND